MLSSMSRSRLVRSFALRAAIAVGVFALRTLAARAQEPSPSAAAVAPAVTEPAAPAATASTAPVAAPAAAATPKPPDPTGAITGTAADVPVKDPANPTVAEVMETVGHNKISINVVWTLIAGFLVMFMQTGFAMVETGFTRAKNAAHTFSMNYMVYPIGMFGYWLAASCRWAGRSGGRPETAPLNSEFVINLFGHPFEAHGDEGLLISSDVCDVGVSRSSLQMVSWTRR